MVDKSILKAIKERDEAAFQKMYEICIRYVYSIVKRYVSNESDHQDVIQEIFARLFLSIDSYNEKKGEFKFWLRQLTINQCIQHYHKQSAFTKIIPLDAESNLISNLNEKISELSKDEIMLYLKKMPEGYKQIFMLVVIDDYTHQEISKMLNISPETSRSQFFRAKHWLRENFSSNNIKLMVDGF